MKLGLALGGGGARGLAHIPMLEVFDELGIRPHRIAGTSIGAVIGAMYASGMSGRRIREIVWQMTAVSPRGQFLAAWKEKKKAPRWVEFFDVDFSRKGLFRGDRFIAFLYETMGTPTFETLVIPLTVVTTDFWTGKPVVLSTGPLMAAVKASMGLPGFFTPVTLDGRVLIDGGGVNPVPYDLLFDECDIVVAIDVTGRPKAMTPGVPGPLRSVMHMFDILQSSIMQAKLDRHRPDLYLRPDITDIQVLDFFKVDEIFRQAEPARLALREALLSWQASVKPAS